MESVQQIVEWIYGECEYIERLDPCFQSELVKQFRKGIAGTPSEIMALKFALSKGCYEANHRRSPYPETNSPSALQGVRIPRYRIPLSQICGGAKLNAVIKTTEFLAQ